MRVLIGLAAMAALMLGTAPAHAASLRAWTGSTTDYNVGNAEGVAFKSDEDGEGEVDVLAGFIRATSVSGPNFDQGGGGGSVTGDSDTPIITNTSQSKQPIQIMMTYGGGYLVPAEQDASASSTGSVLLRTSEGVSVADITHTAWYSQGEFRYDTLENKIGKATTSITGNGLIDATVKTGLLFMDPGETAEIIVMLALSSVNGADAAFGSTAYMSIFVEDKSAFSYDPQISWIYEFGEEGNGPGADPDVNAVPLPAGFPLLVIGMAGLATIRRRRQARA